MFKESAIDLDIPIDENTPPCPALSKELLQKHARGKLVLLMAVDKMLMKRFGPSWIEVSHACQLNPHLAPPRRMI
jgi:hypothetical protein